MALDTRSLLVTQLRLAADACVVTLGAQSTYGVLNLGETLAEDPTGEPIDPRAAELHVAANTLTGVKDGTVLSVRRKTDAPRTAVSYTVLGRPRPRENGDVWAIRVRT